MPYATDRDRNPHQLELEQVPWPAPPLNFWMVSGYQPGVFDLMWDDPSSLSLNSRFSLCGINIYRSFDSEFGPFERITDLPLGTSFWRDRTDNAMELGEVVPDECWLLRGSAGVEYNGARYVFKTQHYPIVKAGSQAIPADRPSDVQVYVDGVEARVLRVDGEHGEIELDPVNYPEVATQTKTPAVVPGLNSVVTVSYRWNRSLVRTDLQQRVFYRITTVGHPAYLPYDKCNSSNMVETPLERAAATSNAEIEKLDWIWREAVRRNRWILDQGGERVKLFIRKQVGITCPCSRGDYKQPLNDCPRCFGTTILGGYEGPYDVVIAPDDAERRIAQQSTGRTVEHVYEVWMGPTPLVSQRDFILKIDGSRYSVGPVRRPTNRGMVLQQHFNIGILDEKDVRHTVPVDNPQGFVLSQLDPVVPPQHFPALETEKPNIPNERELRGRTAAWENIVY